MNAEEYFAGLKLREHPDIRGLLNRGVYNQPTGEQFQRAVEQLAICAAKEGWFLDKEEIAEILCHVLNGNRE